MERIYAFTDESGAFGWDLDNETVSTHFIISSIIVREADINVLREKVEAIRIKYFQKGEMKSSKIGKNHKRRERIIKDLVALPFNVLTVVFDKRMLAESKGLRYKKSFYKFINNIVYKELRHAYKILTIVADEIGGSNYMESFSKYVKKKQDVPNLWGEAEFAFESSQNNVLIQLADFIAGTISFEYDLHKVNKEVPQYSSLLSNKIIRTEIYPKTVETYKIEDSPLAKKYDKEIAELSLKAAVDFINENQNKEEEEVQAQLIILKYLLFRFMNNDTRGYISTKELKNQLVTTDFKNISTQSFRRRIIGSLRDKGVIISSSSTKKGYKLPATDKELFDFVNHDISIIMPMLGRLKKCRDFIKLGTVNRVDLFDSPEYISLKRFFDN